MAKKSIKKRNILAFVLTVAASFTLFTTAYAYLTDHGTAKNVFTIGNDEHKTDENFTPPRELKKETTFKKEVKIANTGDVPAFIRVYVGFTDGYVEDRTVLSADPILTADISNHYYTPLTTDTTIKYSDNAADDKTYTPYCDSDALRKLGWVYEKSDDANLGGWYYYTKKVPAGKSTDYLFRTVKTVFQNESDARAYSINVYSESVQAFDLNGKEYNDADYMKAWSEYLNDK